MRSSKSRSRNSVSDEVGPVDGSEDMKLLFESLSRSGRLGGGSPSSPSKGRMSLSRHSIITSSGDLSKMTLRRGGVMASETMQWLPKYLLLISLYFMQGIPLGLLHGTMPFLLKSSKGNSLSFTDLGLFSLASYPYSLKLLWSPIVDSFYIPRFGRRKTWIIPTQLLIGAVFVWIGSYIDAWIDDADTKIRHLTMSFIFLIFLCATQDIAVDGWALTLLDPDQVHYSSTCQTVGINTGYFVSFTLFLAFNSPDFCNKYLRTVPRDVGLLGIASFLRFWGMAFILGTLAVAVLKHEASLQQRFVVPMNFRVAYNTIMRILRLPNIQRFAPVLLLGRLGFVATDAVMSLKLVERGFPKEDLALAVLLDFPVQITVGFMAAKWTSGPRPLWAWRGALLFKFSIAILAMFVLALYPSDGVISTAYFLLVMVLMVLASSASTILYVSMSSFFSRVSDASVGGTYMTLLTTMSNLGGLWPKLLVMSAVDWFSIRDCRTQPCRIVVDGYYIVNALCVAMGLVLAAKILMPIAQKLESLPPRSWHVNPVVAIPAHLANLV